MDVALPLRVARFRAGAIRLMVAVAAGAKVYVENLSRKPAPTPASSRPRTAVPPVGSRRP